jgi:hypothetical protein
MNVIASVFGDLKQSRVLNAQLNAAALVSSVPQDLYALLKAYYYNNSLYDRMITLLGTVGENTSEIKGLRNPSYRTVEFYVGHVWNGDLQVDPKSTKNAALVKDINTTWDWCNWKQKKSLAVRWCAMYGDLFIKIVRDDPGNHVGFQLIDPSTVTVIKRDVLHGDVTYIRIDTPIEVETEVQTLLRSTLGVKLHTEEWDLAKDTYKVWEHEKSITTATGKLGTAKESHRIKDHFGIDFLPFVHVMFKDVGENRGVGAYTLQIDKIDEVNRMATRLNHILYRYNRVLYALKSNSMDKDGRPIPAPQIGNTSSRNANDDGTVNLGGDRFIRLPGMSELDLLVPNIDYTSHLNTIKDQMNELSEDLPEMEYYRLRDNADVSARAVWYKMSPALKRAAEVRSIMDAALVKANKMALIIASRTRALPNEYGSTTSAESHGEMLRDPALDHKIQERPLLELSLIDQAELERSKIEMIGAKKSAGVDTRTILEEMGYDNVEEMIERKKQELIDMQSTFQSLNGPMPSNNERRQDDQQQNGNVRNVRGFESQ